jgi:hypothetical protein
LLDTFKGFEGAEEDACAFAFGFAGDVQAVMIAVDEIDVSVAGRSEKDGVAGSRSGGGMGGWVVGAEVGFYFYDAGG